MNKLNEQEKEILNSLLNKLKEVVLKFSSEEIQLLRENEDSGGVLKIGFFKNRAYIEASPYKKVGIVLEFNLNNNKIFDRETFERDHPEGLVGELEDLSKYYK